MMEGVIENLSSPIVSISEIKPIEYGGINFKNRSEIKNYVESPLVSACEHFWDLNIKTLMSSANSKDINGTAYINLDYDSLSEENKVIAKEFGEIFKNQGMKPTNAININILEITPETTSFQVEEKSKTIANLFKKQKANWVVSLSIQEMRKNVLHDDPNDENITKDYFDNYYFDSESGKFFDSEELFKKTKENI